MPSLRPGKTADEILTKTASTSFRRATLQIVISRFMELSAISGPGIVIRVQSSPCCAGRADRNQLESVKMSQRSEPNAVETDGRFFGALLRGDTEELERILDGDFMIVDVISGGVTSRSDLLQAISNRALRFSGIDRDPSDLTVRRFDRTAVLLGQTAMTMVFEGQELTTLSRYTHVFRAVGVDWQLVAAQGTRIV